MRMIRFDTLILALLVSACTDTGRPASTETLSPQPDASNNQANPEQQGNAFSISTNAYYQAILHSPSSAGRVISLSLTPQCRAEMTTNYLDKNPVVLDTGEWTTLHNGNLWLNLRRVGKKEGRFTLEFKTDGNKLVYIGSDYGTEGLILWVKPLPESN